MNALTKRATPLAACMASLAGIDLSSLSSAEPIIKRADIVARIAPAGRTVAREGEVLPPLAESWAGRVAVSKRTVPHFYQTMECKVDALLVLQAELGDPGIRLADFVVLALARVLRDMPVANARWSDDGILERQTVDIAIGTGNAAVEPVIVAGADRLGLRGIAAARQAAPAQSGLMSGGFMLLDLSALDIDQAGAIVDPLNAGVLAIGAVREQPVVEAGEVRIAKVMRCTLSADHRVLDGSVGAEFLVALRERLECPTLLLL